MQREKPNSFKEEEAEWATVLVAGLQAQLDHHAHEVQAKLSEAWEQAEQAGHDRGFSAGAADAKAKLQKKNDKLLAEREATSQKALTDLEERLQLGFEASLRHQEAQDRREFDLELARATAQAQADLEAARQQARTEAEEPLKAELARLRKEATASAELERRLRDEFASKLQQVAQDHQNSFQQELQGALARALPLPAREGDELQGTVPAQTRAGDVVMALAEAREEGHAEGLQEGLRRLDEYKSLVTLEKRSALEEGYQKGHAAAQKNAEQEIMAAHDEGYRQGQRETERAASKVVDAAQASGVVLDEAKRQGYQSGYEDGRGVGLAKGRREADSAFASKLQEANRQGYREGYADGKRQAGGGERAWALGILHLSDQASAIEIKQHYKRLSMLLHPDQNPGIGDEYIKNLNRAKDLLGL